MDLKQKVAEKKRLGYWKKENIKFYKYKNTLTPYHRIREEALKKYEENEDINAHTENYLLLAELYGATQEVKAVKTILKHRNKNGHLNFKHSEWMYKNINPYYKHLNKIKFLLPGG